MSKLKLILLDLGTKENFTLNQNFPKEFKQSQWKKAKKRAKGICESCGKPTTELKVKHLVGKSEHIKKFAVDWIRRNCAENLLCVCPECLPKFKEQELV